MFETTSFSEAGGFWFGPFRFLQRERRLEKDGVPVKLVARALDILLALAETAGEVVSKNDLLERLWPGLSVDDRLLCVHMTALRKALGDGTAGARYIANVAGRGYALVAETVNPPASNFQLPPIWARYVEPQTPAAGPTNLPHPTAQLSGRENELTALAGIRPI